jgi:hypothetical protein
MEFHEQAIDPESNTGDRDECRWREIVVSLTFASWNQMAVWLRELEELRCRA